MKDITVIRRMTTEDLADEIDAALDACTQRQRLLAQNIVAGKEPGQAVLDAGYSLYETEGRSQGGLHRSVAVKKGSVCITVSERKDPEGVHGDGHRRPFTNVGLLSKSHGR